jgi:hypothetical protein
MFSTLEFVAVIVVVGGLLLFQMRTQAGSLFPYLTFAILLLVLILATRIIRSLVGVVIVLAVFCVVLLWRLVRQRRTLWLYSRTPRR